MRRAVLLACGLAGRAQGGAGAGGSTGHTWYKSMPRKWGRRISARCTKLSVPTSACNKGRSSKARGVGRDGRGAAGDGRGARLC